MDSVIVFNVLLIRSLVSMPEPEISYKWQSTVVLSLQTCCIISLLIYFDYIQRIKCSFSVSWDVTDMAYNRLGGMFLCSNNVCKGCCEGIICTLT